MCHYNAEFIQECLRSFTEEMLTYTGSRTVLFDADNTLYLFSQHGTDKETARTCHNRGFFKNLPIFQEAPYVLENLQRFGLRVGIISKYRNGYAHDEKLQSFHYHFPMVPDSLIYLVSQEKSKVEVVPDIRHTILVDDYYANINEWYENGGIAIKKSYSGKPRPVPVVCNLIDIFYELHVLNFLK